MPFIVPTAYFMYKIKQLHIQPIHLRINFLKQIYYGRLASYPLLFLVSNIHI